MRDTEHARDHQVGDRVDADGHVRLDLVRHDHVSQLGGDRGARPRNDDEGRQDGSELARDDHDEDGVQEAGLTEPGENSPALDDDHRPERQGGQGDDVHRLHAGEQDLQDEHVEGHLAAPHEQHRLLQSPGKRTPRA